MFTIYLSRVEDGCNCVQRRCHEETFPSLVAPEDCLQPMEAGTPPWSFLLGGLTFLMATVAILLFLRWRRGKRRSQLATSETSPSDPCDLSLLQEAK